MGIQKAIVAIIGGVFIIANEAFGANIGIDDATLSGWVNAIIGMLTAVGVWGVRNKGA